MGPVFAPFCTLWRPHRGGHGFLSICALLALSLACEAETQVETRVHVGERIEPSQHAWANEPAPETPNPELVAAKQVWSAMRADWRAAQDHEADAAPDLPSLGPNITKPATTAREFAELVEQLRTGPLDEVALPAHNLRLTDAQLWPSLHEILIGPRKGSKTEFKKILALFGGDVPNRYGHFALHWKKNHGFRVKVSEDWFKDLLSLPLGKVSHMLHPVYRDAVLVVAAIHGAAHIAKTEPALADEVVASLLDAAYMHRGTFRDEVGRAMASIGDEAVPALVLAAVPPKGGRDEDAAHLRARYASYNLDQMDRIAPSKALASASTEPRRLIALLDAYATARPGDAAGPLLRIADDPSPAVRMAARLAFEAYVTGPPPRMKTRTIRRRGGKTVRRQAYLSYRALAANAIRSTLETQAPDLLEELCELRRENGSYDQNCIEQPARHADAWFGHLDQERRHMQERALNAAIDGANQDPTKAADDLSLMLRDGAVEADSPLLGDIAGVLLRSAAAADQDPVQRAGKLRSTARLVSRVEPKRARDLRILALREEAKSEGLTTKGREMLLAQASALSPNGASASTEAEATEPSTAETLGDNFMLGLLYLFGAFGCLGWLGARRTKRPLRLA